MKKHFLPKTTVLVLILAAMLTMAAILPEPQNTILFLVAIPLVVQLIKLYRDRTGNAIGKLGNQIISLVFTLAFTALSGGFAGLVWPALPVWSGELILFIGSMFAFVGGVASVIGASWGSMMVLYEVIWDRLFVAVGLATGDKYA